MRKLKLVMLASLILMSSKALPAQELGWDLNSSQVHTIAERLKDGEKCELDLNSTTRALLRCQSDMTSLQTQFWQEPGFILGGMVVSFSFGAAVAFTKCFGLCR